MEVPDIAADLDAERGHLMDDLQRTGDLAETQFIDDFLIRYFNDQELVVAEDNLVRVGSFTGKEDRLERFKK